MKKKVLAATTAGLLGGAALVGLDAGSARAATPVTPSHASWQGTGRHVSATPTAAARTLTAPAARTATTSPLGAVTVADNDGFVPSSTLVPVTITAPSSTTALYTLQIAYGQTSFPLDLPAGSYTIPAQIPGATTTTVSHTFAVAAGTDMDEALGNYTTDSPTATFMDFADNVSQAAGVAVLSLRDAAPLGGPLTVKIDGTATGTTFTDGVAADVKIPGGSHTIEVDSAAGPVYTNTATFTADNLYAEYLFNVDNSSNPTPSAGLNANVFIQGYQFAAADGGVFNYGGRQFAGSLGNIKLAAPIVGGANFNPYTGYYLAGSDGGVFAFGAKYQGSLGGVKLAKPIVGMTDTVGNDGNGGYLLLGADGGVFAFNTPFYGSLGGRALSSPAVAIAADPGSGDYAIAQADGTVTIFNSQGTTVLAPPAPHLNAPIVGIAEVPQSLGIYLVASDGGVFAEGNAGFVGSAGNIKLAQPVVGIIPTYDGLGYYLIAKDGGVFAYGNATFYGSTGNIKLVQPVVTGLNS